MQSMRKNRATDEQKDALLTPNYNAKTMRRRD